MASSALDLFRLDGRHAVISGGAGLLGPFFAEALLEAGARVTLLDIDRPRLQRCEADLAARFPGRLAVAACDLTDARAVEAAVAAAESDSSIGILLNSAAIDPKAASGSSDSRLSSGFVNYPVEAWRRSMDVNLTGIFLVTQAVCRLFEKRDRGVIINVSSTYGMVGPDQRIYEHTDPDKPKFVKPGDYSTTKAGLIGFTKYLAAYYARTAIRVNALTLGGVYADHDERFVKAYSARTILGRMARRDEYKGPVLFLCSDASSYMTGSNLIVDGGWTAL